MARIRTIKPEFWTDEKIVELSFQSRLLFIGMWNFADDDGRLVHSPKRIKMQILPADTVDIDALLAELRASSLIQVYSVSGVEYIQISNFSKHQKVDRRTDSKLPPPNSAEPPREESSTRDSSRVVTEPLPNTRRALDESSTSSAESLRVPPSSPDGREGNGREGNRSRKGMEKDRSPTGSRLTLDTLPDDWRDFCQQERTDLNPASVFDQFRDYWVSVPGARGRKSDWLATWRNWVRTQKKINGAHPVANKALALEARNRAVVEQALREAGHG